MMCPSSLATTFSTDCRARQRDGHLEDDVVDVLKLASDDELETGRRYLAQTLGEARCACSCQSAVGTSRGHAVSVRTVSLI